MAEEHQEFTKEIEKYKSAGANMLMPSTHISGLSEFHAPVIETVMLSSNPEEGDVYAHDNAESGPRKKWRPTKQALMKLSVCAGVIWSPSLSNRIDKGADRNYIAYKAVGGIKKADGQPVFFSGEYDIDFEVMEEELREQYEKKAKTFRDKSDKEKVEYVEYCVKRDLLQKRKFKLRLCEAGAMNRVLRMLLGIKQAYTTEELKKPFVMARIVFRPDYNDKDVRQQFVAAHIKSMTGIYGPEALDANVRAAEPIDITPMREGDLPADDDPSADNPPEQSSIESRVVDFGSCEVTAQCKILHDLSKQKGYDLQDFIARSKTTLDKITQDKRTGLFRHLLEKPDVASDDVPY